MKRIFKSLLFCCVFFLILEFLSRGFLLIPWVDSTISKSVCDVTSRWEWVRSHRSGEQIKYRFCFDKYDPTKGWGLIPGFRSPVINTNSRGIRGNIEYRYARDRGKLRILFLGDSFTFGNEVSDNETYPYYLQQMLPDAEVINMGVHGYGHDQILIYLKEEGIKYKPDIIILGYLTVDSDRNMQEFTSYAKPGFRLVNNELKVYNIPVPTPDKLLQWEPWRSRVVDLLNILRYDISLKDGYYAKEKEILTDAILKEIAITTKSIGAVPVFVYLSDVRDKDPNPGMTEEEKDFFEKCGKISVKSAFLRQMVYNARSTGVKIKDIGHFGPETNRLVALGIKEYLLKNGLLEKKK